MIDPFGSCQPPAQYSQMAFLTGTDGLYAAGGCRAKKSFSQSIFNFTVKKKKKKVFRSLHLILTLQ